MKKLLCFVLALSLAFSVFGCTPKTGKRTDDIVILFTNDIHCAVDSGVTLSGVAWYKKQMQAKTSHVVLVDCGDIVAGSPLGTISKGELPLSAANAVGYDYCILGNHEFDYNLSGLMNIVSHSKAQYLGCNITYSGSGENPFKDIKPYEIRDFEGTKVAFVGVTTPDTLYAAAPAYLQENGELVVSFGEADKGLALVESVQKTVDEARSAGADFVVVLAHMGVEGNYLVQDLIAATTGIDVVLDGHSHTEYTYFNQENKNGQSVICAQTGTQLANLGQLVITADGLITVSLISDIVKHDIETAATINELLSAYTESLSTVVAHSDTTLSLNNEKGYRAVRVEETALGNLCSDAYRYVTGADIAFVNGGSIRANLNAGDITYSDIMSVMPFDNYVCAIEITGAELRDILEYFVSGAAAECYAENGKPIGEFGSFPQMSGITFTFDPSIETSVIVNEADTLTGVAGARRVSDIKVLDGDTYLPLDLDRTYTLALTDYAARNGGSGMGQYLTDNPFMVEPLMTGYEALIVYITEGLDGKLGQYATCAGRVTRK